MTPNKKDKMPIVATIKDICFIVKAILLLQQCKTWWIHCRGNKKQNEYTVTSLYLRWWRWQGNDGGRLLLSLCHSRHTIWRSQNIFFYVVPCLSVWLYLALLCCLKLGSGEMLAGISPYLTLWPLFHLGIPISSSPATSSTSQVSIKRSENIV